MTAGEEVRRENALRGQVRTVGAAAHRKRFRRDAEAFHRGVNMIDGEFVCRCFRVFNIGVDIFHRKLDCRARIPFF